MCDVKPRACACLLVGMPVRTYAVASRNVTHVVGVGAWALQAIKLKPRFCDAYNNLASVHMHLGNSKQAIETYQMALMLNPALVDAHSNLGNLYKAQVGAASRTVLHLTAFCYAEAVAPARLLSHCTAFCTTHRPPRTTHHASSTPSVAGSDGACFVRGCNGDIIGAVFVRGCNGGVLAAGCPGGCQEVLHGSHSTATRLRHRVVQPCRCVGMRGQQ
jgi:hypothetical protein